MTEENFTNFWESTISRKVPEEVVKHWRSHELSAVSRGEVIVKQINQFVNLHECRVLDLGCGYGGISVATAMTGASVIGVDIDIKRIRGASIRAKYDYPGIDVRLLQGGGERIALSSGVFDVIICNDVLEHVKIQVQVLREIERVLKPGGLVYLQFPNLLSLKNFLSDPHYGLFGVSILPAEIGEWYVVSLRKKTSNYGVGSFPIASRIVGLLNHLNIEIVKWWPAPKRKIRIFSRPLQLFRLNTQSLITIIGRKK